MLIIAISIVAAFTAVDTAVATTYYVDVDATGDDDGSSWANAFNYLQDALDDVSSGDEIWVAEGTYYPDEGDSVTDSNRTETFQLVDGVGIYGGFDGSETTRSQRDWSSNVTTLSGDIDKDGVLDDDNSYHVVYSYDCGAGTVLDGFTITKGYADAYPDYDSGGGMYNDDSSPTVINCRFTGSYALYGGGMANFDNAETAVINCTFIANSAYSGGAMDNYRDADVTVINSMFFMNSASNPSNQPVGGAMSNSRCGPELTNCTFVGNVAGGENIAGIGGALFLYGMSADPNTVATNCLFWGNWATESGGGGGGTEIYCNTSAIVLTIGYCDVEGGWDGPKVFNWDDDITDAGGNINADPKFGNIFDFSDITIAAGTTTTVKVEDASRFSVDDEIEYDNDGTARKVTYVNTLSDTITFANDALSSSSVVGKIIFNWGSGATDLDEDFHIESDSPCIDAGDPNGSYTGQADIDGEERVQRAEVDIGGDEIQIHYYVDAATGSDSDDGLTWATAFATIQKGIDTAKDGDTIEVEEGTYEETISFDKECTVTSTDPTDSSVVAATIIDADGSSNAVSFKGFHPVLPYLSADEAPVVTGFTVKDASSRCVSAAGGSPTVSNCVIQSDVANSYGVYCSTPGTATIENCTIKKTGSGMQYGIQCYTSDPIVRYNVIHSMTEGIQIYYSDPIVKSNIIRDCGTYGIRSAGAGDAVIRNNTIVDNDYATGIYHDSGTAPTISNCILWGNNDDLYNCSATYSCIEDADAGTGNIPTDPNFVDSENYDYHLNSGSPCIDVGDPNGTYTGEVDIDGEDRVIDISGKGDGTVDVDMGADEYDD